MNSSVQKTGLLVLGFVATLGIGGVTYIAIEKAKIDAEKNHQTQIERVRIEAEADVRRTQERMNAFPWYKGGENKNGK